MGTVFRLRRRRAAPRRLVAALFLLTLVALLAACGSAATTTSREAVPAIPPVTRASVAASTAAAASAARPAQGAAQGAPATTNQSGPLPATLPGVLLIRTGAMEIEASDPLAVVAAIRQIAESAAAGADVGYVSDEREQSTSSLLTATITIQVPAATFNTVMGQLRRLGDKVVSETSSSQDVSEQFVDVEARLQALRATQAQLLQLLDKTQRLDDTIAVQRQLTDINTQIEQLEGRENYLKSHSAFSTITVSIHQPATVVKAPLNWSPLATLLGAAGALGVVAQRAVDVLIWLLVFGLPLAALAGAALLIQRGISRLLRQRAA